MAASPRCGPAICIARGNAPSPSPVKPHGMLNAGHPLKLYKPRKLPSRSAAAAISLLLTTGGSSDSSPAGPVEVG